MSAATATGAKAGSASPALSRDAREPVWVDDVVAAARPTGYMLSIVTLCVVVAMVEGYDTQVMALAAPLVAKAWALSTGTVGLLLTASVVGMVAGSFLFSPLGDRSGRRPGVLLGMVIAGLATAAGAWMPTVGALMATRFVAGIGLGLALPNVIAVAMEVVPARWRVLTIVFVSCGYPLGGALGSAGVGALIPTHGFPVTFFAGGIATLLVVLVCLAVLPESPLFLVRRPTRAGELERLLRRLGGGFAPNPVGFAIREAAPPRSRVAALFQDGRARATLLLWLVNFANLSMVYFFVNWLPSIIVGTGQSARAALMAISIFSFSGIIGGVLLAFGLRAVRATRLLGAAYVIAMACALALAWTFPAGGAFLALIAVAGGAIVGSQFCLAAVVNQFYPSAIRATASGYATGAGRLGAVVAPLAGAAVVGAVVQAQHALAAAAVPAGLALLTVWLLERGGSLEDTAERSKGAPR